VEFNLPEEQDMLALGARLASVLSPPLTLHLHGNLGAGKTTLVRGILTGLGHTGRVKSPTYTLVENYRIGEGMYYHFDLYRLGDPEELEAIGFRDYLDTNAVCFIEWPERAQGYLTPPDLDIRIETAGNGRRLRIEAPGLADSPGGLVMTQLELQK
jgi:tRNA threonylcarbamoyladenosine biosynthesis protein TsaE